VGESEVAITVADKRKQLTVPITYACTAQNASVVIRDILTGYYPITETATYFDLTDWESASAASPLVSLNMQKPQPAIEIIEWLSAAIFGVFFIDNAGRYGFKVINADATARTTFHARDIMNVHSIVYDPAEVISSVRVGYGRDWITTGTQYSYVTDTSEEAATYLKYKTYNEKTFETPIDGSVQAASYAATILNYTKDVHGMLTIEVPMSYYYLEIGEIMDTEIRRPASDMVGTVRTEIVSISYRLDRGTVAFGLRIV